MKNKGIKYPKSFSHIGITVPDINKAVEFYNNVMGWYIIMHPLNVKKKSEMGQMTTAVFGDEWEEFDIAHMSTSDGIGIELFSFPHGNKQGHFKPFDTGLFHFAVQDPDVERLTKEIIEHGGKQRMPVTNISPKDASYKMVYVEDPFGVVFEIYSHSYEVIIKTMI